MYCKNCGQKTERGIRFCKNCGGEIPNQEKFYQHIFSWVKQYKGFFILLFVVLFIIAVIAAYDDSGSDTSDYQPDYSNEYVNPVRSAQNKIASSVVNIMCPDNTEDGGSGGSGTIMYSEGIILTNAHIIPQNLKGESTAKLCIVTLPDEKGQAKEIYYAEPILIPKLSNSYDLAFLEIIDVYEDEDGMKHGHYPNVFPGFIDSICENDDVSLGDPVRVFGYPAISGGGLFLTVTDGVVSSIPNDGTIVTSAKIEHGNSGGIAVDGNGCFIGVPAMVQTGTIESLGVIISNYVVLDFLNEVSTLLNKTSN